MTLAPLVRPESHPIPEDEDSSRIESFEVTVQVDEKTFEKQQKTDSIRR